MSDPLDTGNPMDRRAQHNRSARASGVNAGRFPAAGCAGCMVGRRRRSSSRASPARAAGPARGEDRIAALVDPAIDALQRALDHKDVNAAVRAARDLLDRAGLAARGRHRWSIAARCRCWTRCGRIEAKEDAARGR